MKPQLSTTKASRGTFCLWLIFVAPADTEDGEHQNEKFSSDATERDGRNGEGRQNRHQPTDFQVIITHLVCFFTIQEPSKQPLQLHKAEE